MKIVRSSCIYGEQIKINSDFEFIEFQAEVSRVPHHHCPTVPLPSSQSGAAALLRPSGLPCLPVIWVEVGVQNLDYHFLLSKFVGL